MKELKVENGGVTLVDDEDYNRFVVYKWYENNKGYLAAVISREGQRQFWEQLHRFILGVTDARFEVHHKEGNKRDNRKVMLEVLTIQEHVWMRGPNKRGSSKFKGVSWASSYGRWTAHIQKGQKQKNIGFFLDEVEAAKAYDKYALTWFGERSYLNFPPEPVLI